MALMKADEPADIDAAVAFAQNTDVVAPGAPS
jgi:hypothetical protein